MTEGCVIFTHGCPHMDGFFVHGWDGEDGLMISVFLSAQQRTRVRCCVFF